MTRTNATAGNLPIKTLAAKVTGNKGMRRTKTDVMGMTAC